MILVLLSLAILALTQVIFISYASFVDGSAVYIHPYIDAYIGGYGNTIHADLAFLFGLISLLRFGLSRTNDQHFAAKIAKFIGGKLMGVVNFLVLLFALLGNGALVYLKVIEKNPLHIAITGNGYAEIGIIICMIVAFFVSRRSLSTVGNH